MVSSLCLSLVLVISQTDGDRMVEFVAKPAFEGVGNDPIQLLTECETTRFLLLVFLSLFTLTFPSRPSDNFPSLSATPSRHDTLTGGQSTGG